MNLDNGIVVVVALVVAQRKKTNKRTW